MTVKSVIAAALKMISRGETAEKVEDGADTCEEETELIKTLVCCYNAVEDEVARAFVPLIKTQTLQSENGKYYYADFSETPLKIVGVKVYGLRADYKVYDDYLFADAGKITVEYAYLPPRKNINSHSAFGYAVDLYLLAAGVCAEYCLINGEVEAAELWDKKYREGIKNLLCAKTATPVRRLPQRRWI